MGQAPKNDFFENGLCTLCHMARDELIHFNHFHTETEANWKARDMEIQNEIAEQEIVLPEEQHDDILGPHYWELHLSQFKYPSIHRESLVIVIFNFLEDQLNKICEIISESIESKIKLKDLNDKGVERALKYLTKVGDFDLSRMGHELPYIKSVNQLRNQIVHNGGSLPVDPNHNLNEFVSRTSTLSGNPGGHISLSPDFIGEFIGVLTEFFEKLDHEVQSFNQSFNE